ncbi:hypothetical protein D3C85_1899510 [compost metagenome]
MIQGTISESLPVGAVGELLSCGQGYSLGLKFRNRLLIFVRWPVLPARSSF